MELQYEKSKAKMPGTMMVPALDFAAERAEMLRSVESGKLSKERYDVFDQKLRELESRHSEDAAKVREKFDAAKESLLRDT